MSAPTVEAWTNTLSCSTILASTFYYPRRDLVPIDGEDREQVVKTFSATSSVDPKYIEGLMNSTYVLAFVGAFSFVVLIVNILSEIKQQSSSHSSLMAFASLVMMTSYSTCYWLEKYIKLVYLKQDAGRLFKVLTKISTTSYVISLLYWFFT